MKKLITSESVSEGHPDKVADQISDAIVDYCLKNDSKSRVACETMCTTNKVVVSGEITTEADICFHVIDEIVRNTVREIGYDFNGFDCNNLVVQSNIHEQSKDIALGVNETDTHEQGAGDQGIMFGYAEFNPSTNHMPIPIFYAHKMMEKAAEYRKNMIDGMKFLRPDAKCQMTFDCTDYDNPFIENVLVSHQHTEQADREELEILFQKMMKEVIPDGLLRNEPTFLFNPTGRFVVGGPDGDCGMTGRKIVVDAYGADGHVGGGAFSGKDPSKVDRSAAYMSRLAAKTVVANGICRRCEVSVAYAIGLSKPLQLGVNTFGTGNDGYVLEFIKENFDFRPKAIIEQLGLNNPDGWSYLQTAKNGHFGHNEFPWEKI